SAHFVVLHEEMLDFPDHQFPKLVQTMHVLVALRLNRNGDQAIVACLLSILVDLSRLDHTNEPARDETAGESRRIHDHEDIQWIAVVALRGWDKPEIEGKGRADRQHGPQLKNSKVRIELQL